MVLQLGTDPRCPHAGDRSLPGTSSFTITRSCSQHQEALQFVHAWMDRQTNKSPFHLQAPQQLPEHSSAGVGNLRSHIFVDAVLIGGALLQLAGNSKVLVVPMLGTKWSWGPATALIQGASLPS